MSLHKGIDWDAVDLGQRPDVDIARWYGVTPQVVWTARRRRNIPSCCPRSRPKLIDWTTVGLGERPDSAVAVDLGIPRRSVGTERQRRGIPAFIGLVLRQDGLPCRSIYEAMYDAVLHDRGINHEHEVAYPDLGIIADLTVSGAVVEISGMTGVAAYDRRRSRKIIAYNDAGIDVTWLYPDDVTREYATSATRVKYRERACKSCGVSITRIVKGVCQSCRLRDWRRETAITRICVGCVQPYESAASDTNRRFCSRICYWQSMELPWPPWAELDDLLRDRSTAEVARMLGVKPATLAMRLHRRRLRNRVSGNV